MLVPAIGSARVRGRNYRPFVALVSVDGAVGRAVQRMAGSAAFARVGPKIVPPLDRLLHRVSGGRILVSRALLPSLVLTTTGRRSGLPRESPLMCVPETGGSFLVVGSNFGREAHPAWTANLLARPEASASHGGRDVAVTAELLEGEARDEAWEAALRVWPTFASYRERSGRELRVFRLHPV